MTAEKVKREVEAKLLGAVFILSCGLADARERRLVVGKVSAWEFEIMRLGGIVADAIDKVRKAD